MFVDRYYFQNHRVSWAAAGFITGLVLLESKTRMVLDVIDDCAGGWLLVLAQRAVAAVSAVWGIASAGLLGDARAVSSTERTVNAGGQ